MYERILVPTDGSEGASGAVEEAVRLARRFGATVHALYAVDPRMSPITSSMDREAVLDLVERSEQDPTAPVLDRADREGVPTVEAIRTGVPDEAIAAYVDEADVDLVVMGTHGRTGIDRYLLGSVTERVLRRSTVPVMTVRTHGDPGTDADS